MKGNFDYEIMKITKKNIKTKSIKISSTFYFYR